MVRTRSMFLSSILLAGILSYPLAVRSQSEAAFTYQGYLEDGGQPANGSYDLSFAIYTVASGGSPHYVDPSYSDDLAVADGVFTAVLDFGGQSFIYALGSETYYIEIGVRPGSVANSNRTGYTMLSPRQRIHPSPGALYSQNSKMLGGLPSASYSVTSHKHAAADVTSGELADARIPAAIARDSEVMPTVLANDGSGSTLDADLLDGVHGSSFMLAATDNWVNTSGDLMTGRLYIESSTPCITADYLGSEANKSAIQGFASSNVDVLQYGGSFSVGSSVGIAIDGLAGNSGNVANTGGSFTAKGQMGKGVVGLADATVGQNYGGHFSAAGSTGTGVYAQAGSTTGKTHGGSFKASSPDGVGVRGENVATTGSAIGGLFTSTSSAGTGAYGEASSLSGSTYGGYFKSASSTGHAVHGVASNPSGQNYGGYFTAAGGQGHGVYAFASATGNITNYGGYFRAEGNSAEAVVGFAASKTGTNVGGSFRADGTTAMAVIGSATATGVITNKGGVFTSAGDNGIGVQGTATGAYGFGGYFTGNKSYVEKNLGVGAVIPMANAHVLTLNNWGPGATGNGWGDLCIGIDNAGTSTDYGLCMGVATSGGGAGMARIWNHLSTGQIRVGNQSGDILYINGATAAYKVGVNRDPTTNTFEVGGTASKAAAGDWLANSDARIKDDIRTITGALDTLDRVRLVDFVYTEEYRRDHPGLEDRRHMNVVAQEFQQVFPDYVKGSGERLADGSEILQVDPYPLTIYSAAAVQELNAEVRNLREENRRLEERLARLEALLLADNP